MLVVLTSHPIQYQAPLWRALAENRGVPFEVWFLTDQGVRRTEDRDFGKAFAWDVDLLSGYPHKFMELRGLWDMRKFDGIPLAKPIGESLREAGATALWVEGWRFKPFWDAVSAAKKMGIPVFLRGETSDKIAEKGGLVGFVRNFVLHRLFAKVDYFLAIGEASRRFYLRHGVAAEKLLDAPYGVDNEFFRAEAGKIRGLRDQGGKGLRGEGTRQGVRGEGEEGGARQEALGEGGARSARFARDNFENLKEREGHGREARSGGEEQLRAADQKTKRPRDEKEEKGARRGAIGTGEGNLKLRTAAEIRRDWNIPIDAKVVMFCGKFVRKKRPVDLVEAVALHQRQAARGEGQGGGEGTGLVARGERQVGRGATSSLESLASSLLRETQHSWHLLFVGSGELEEELRAACDVRFDADYAGKGREARGEGSEQARGNRQVGETASLEPLASSHARSHARPPATFAGFLNQSEISKAYAVADVVVLPSEAWETWGLVVNEATAAGVPTVVSDRCGCSDDFGAKNPYTRVFPMGDVTAMARAIEEVLALEAKPEVVTKFAEAFSPRITAEAVAGRLRQSRGLRA